MKKTFYLTFGLLMLILAVKSQVVSDFAMDTDYWHSEGDGDFYWEPDAGNPGGCFRVDDDATGAINYAYAPSKFLGNWSGAGATDSISADIYLHKWSGSYLSGYYMFTIKGPGGTASAILGAQPPADVWTTYSATLDPANWTVSSGDWNALLEQITEFIITAEYIYGDEYVRIDNVNLSISPVIIPVEPSICNDFDDGEFDGWSFSGTGGVSNAVFEGRPGRSIKISDGSGSAVAYPPAKYIGDWSLLDNHAAQIIFDLNISTHAGNALNGDYFVKISGPDGEAKFPMNDAYLAAVDQWNTFIFPIDESYWTMESGTWNGLLNWVNDLQIEMEFYDGTEVVWLDNFCLTNAPPVADFTIESQIGFVGDPIPFTDISQNGVSSWLWNFGDMQTSVDKNPTNTYQTSGTYDVELEVSNYYGTDDKLKPGYLQILPIDQCLMFEDDFENPDLFPAWKTKNGTWSLTSAGEIRQSSNYYGNELLDACYAITGSPLWENYLLSCDMYSSDNDYLGFVFDWQDDQNMYMFLWSRQDNERKLVKWVDGSEIVLASDELPYTSSIWYNFKIISHNGIIAVSIDEDEIFSVFDNTYTSGKAGLYCWGNSSSYWDNFRVECSDTETLHIPEGWSGLSSYINPVAKKPESMFSTILTDLTILQNESGAFWPGQNFNTLGNWNTHEGYQIKVANSVELSISGTIENDKILQLNQGWNLIPVLSECEVDVAGFFEGIDAMLIKEVAGTALYWPEFGINTLEVMEPGKAYFVLMNEPATIEFPACDGLKTELISTKTQDESLLGLIGNNTPWTHTVVIPKDLVKDLGVRYGDKITVIDAENICYGACNWIGQNTSITLFGDDPTTPGKDGFEIGEALNFNLLEQTTGQMNPLNVVFEEDMPNPDPAFQTHGLSAIASLKFAATGIAGAKSVNRIQISPNPAKTEFIFKLDGIEVFSGKLHIYSLDGKSLGEYDITTAETRINVSQLEPGVYLLEYETAENRFIRRLIKQ